MADDDFAVMGGAMLPAFAEKRLRLFMLTAVLFLCLCVAGCGPERRSPGPLIGAAAAVCVAVLAVLHRRGGS